MLLTFPCVLFFFFPFLLLPFCTLLSPLSPTNHSRSLSLFFGGLFLLKGSSSFPLVTKHVHWFIGWGGSSNILGSWVFTLPCRALWGSFRWELALYIKVNCQTCSCLWKREQNLKIANNLELPVKTTKYVISSLIFSHKWVYILL